MESPCIKIYKEEHVKGISKVGFIIILSLTLKMIVFMV